MAFASHRYARALAAGLPRQDHVYITNDELFRFHKIEIDEMPCNLDPNENPRLFETYPTPPCLKGGPESLEKEINEILGWKRKDQFSNPFFDTKKVSGSFFVPKNCTILVCVL